MTFMYKCTSYTNVYIGVSSRMMKWIAFCLVNVLFVLHIEAKSRKYQGVFKAKSRVKTWQVRGIWSQQLEHKYIANIAILYK